MLLTYPIFRVGGYFGTWVPDVWYLACGSTALLGSVRVFSARKGPATGLLLALPLFLIGSLMVMIYVMSLLFLLAGPR